MDKASIHPLVQLEAPSAVSCILSDRSRQDQDHRGNEQGACREGPGILWQEPVKGRRGARHLPDEPAEDIEGRLAFR